jgi:undecaprenyl pyrophosphate phosphatase UppP
MEIWQAIILGFVQGLAEFLPISSSGHLILVRNLMGIEGDYLLFDIMLHVGTLGAVGVYFFKDILALFKPPFKKMGLLILATIPAALVGLFLGDYVDAVFMSGKYLCFFFLATAILMFITEFLAKIKVLIFVLFCEVGLCGEAFRLGFLKPLGTDFCFQSLSSAISKRNTRAPFSAFFGACSRRF